MFLSSVELSFAILRSLHLYQDRILYENQPNSISFQTWFNFVAVGWLKIEIESDKTKMVKWRKSALVANNRSYIITRVRRWC